jgi:CxxC-x17-CxxC domain-containing protein
MSFQDMLLCCSVCGASFSISAEEQELQHSWGITTELKQCPSCQRKNKMSIHGENNHGSVQMYPAVCAECGKSTMVPFKPLSGRRIYCSDCYRKVRVYH